MPFGKYRGCDVDELPDDYLRWLWMEVYLRGPLFGEVGREYKSRFETSGHDNGSSHQEEKALAMIDAGQIKKIYWNLARQYHPDKIGGNGEVMKGINLFYEAIKQ